VNGYILIQQAIVGARQDALRAEADTTRLLASARPLPAVSAGSRTADRIRLADDQPMAVAPRSLGAAAAADRPATIKPVTRPAGHRPVGSQHPVTGCGDADCSASVAPAA